MVVVRTVSGQGSIVRACSLGGRVVRADNIVTIESPLLSSVFVLLLLSDETHLEQVVEDVRKPVSGCHHLELPLSAARGRWELSIPLPPSPSPSLLLPPCPGPALPLFRRFFSVARRIARIVWGVLSAAVGGC